MLGPAQIAAVILGVFEEGEEVGDADDIDAAFDLFRKMGQRREDHVAAVAAAHDGDFFESKAGSFWSHSMMAPMSLTSPRA